MHHFPGQRSRIPTARLGWLLPEFFHDRLSSERDIPAQACRFSCFFCAAYGLLLTQTRTRCSNSASRAIAMLEKTAKISPNVCAGLSLSNECGHVENSYVFAGHGTELCPKIQLCDFATVLATPHKLLWSNICAKQ